LHLGDGPAKNQVAYFLSGVQHRSQQGWVATHQFGEPF
jgi:hypothetical protein